MASFLYRRGHGANRRVMHLGVYDKHGEIVGAWCGSRVAFDTSCNLPLGQPVCRKCRKAITKGSCRKALAGDGNG